MIVNIEFMLIAATIQKNQCDPLRTEAGIEGCGALASRRELSFAPTVKTRAWAVPVLSINLLSGLDES